jgi:hypothetical protein
LFIQTIYIICHKTTMMKILFILFIPSVLFAQKVVKDTTNITYPHRIVISDIKYSPDYKYRYFINYFDYQSYRYSYNQQININKDKK